MKSRNFVWASEVPFFITQMWALLATVAKFGPSNDINDRYYSDDPADPNSLSVPSSIIDHSHFFKLKNHNLLASAIECIKTLTNSLSILRRFISTPSWVSSTRTLVLFSVYFVLQIEPSFEIIQVELSVHFITSSCGLE